MCVYTPSRQAPRHMRRPHLFRLVPHSHFTQELLRAGGQLEVKGEAEDAVDTPQEIQTALDLLLDLKAREDAAPQVWHLLNDHCEPKS